MKHFNLSPKGSHYSRAFTMPIAHEVKVAFVPSTNLLSLSVLSMCLFLT